jgi:hypothetical protein
MDAMAGVNKFNTILIDEIFPKLLPIRGKMFHRLYKFRRQLSEQFHTGINGSKPVRDVILYGIKFAKIPSRNVIDNTNKSEVIISVSFQTLDEEELFALACPVPPTKKLSE